MSDFKLRDEMCKRISIHIFKKKGIRSLIYIYIQSAEVQINYCMFI